MATCLNDSSIVDRSLCWGLHFLDNPNTTSPHPRNDRRNQHDQNSLVKLSAAAPIFFYFLLLSLEIGSQ
jgi:hypothetical protein